MYCVSGVGSAVSESVGIADSETTGVWVGDGESTTIGETTTEGVELKEPCSICGNNPCTCEKPPKICPVCGQIPCECENPPKTKLKIKFLVITISSLEIYKE